MSSQIFKVKYAKSKGANPNALRGNRNHISCVCEHGGGIEQKPPKAVKKEKKELKRGDLVAEDECSAKILIKKRLGVTRNQAETDFYYEDTIKGVRMIMFRLIFTAAKILRGEKSLPDCIDDDERVIGEIERWVRCSIPLENLCDNEGNKFSFTAVCLWLGIDEETCRNKILGEEIMEKQN